MGDIIDIQDKCEMCETPIGEIYGNPFPRDSHGKKLHNLGRTLSCVNEIPEGVWVRMNISFYHGKVLETGEKTGISGPLRICIPCAIGAFLRGMQTFIEGSKKAFPKTVISNLILEGDGPSPGEGFHETINLLDSECKCLDPIE